MDNALSQADPRDLEKPSSHPGNHRPRWLRHFTVLQHVP